MGDRRGNLWARCAAGLTALVNKRAPEDTEKDIQWRYAYDDDK